MPYSLHRKRRLIIGDIGGVTSASARCHSTVANSPSEVAACRCSTLYIPDKSMSAADCIGRDWGGVGGFKDSKKKKRRVGYCHLKHPHNKPSFSDTVV